MTKQIKLNENEAMVVQSAMAPYPSDHEMAEGIYRQASPEKFGCQSYIWIKLKNEDECQLLVESLEGLVDVHEDDLKEVGLLQDAKALASAAHDLI